MRKKVAMAAGLVLFPAAAALFVTPREAIQTLLHPPATAQERLLAAVRRGDVRAARAEVQAGADPAPAFQLDAFLSPDMAKALTGQADR